MRVLLDTNILLCAAFNSNSESAKLISNDRVQYYFCELSYNEIISKIDFFCNGNNMLCKRLRKRFIDYIQNYGLISLPPGVITKDLSLPDKDDEAIATSALNHGITKICTYNLKDFNSEYLELTTPGILVKNFHIKTQKGKVPVEFIAIYSQKPKTIILSAKPFSQETMGSIFKMDNDEFYFNEKGWLICTRKSLKIRCYNPLLFKSEQINLVIRNINNRIHVHQLIPKAKIQAGFGSPLKSQELTNIPVYGKGLNYCFGLSDCLKIFYGSIIYGMAWPCKINMKSARKVVQAGSIDPIIGSDNYRMLFKSFLIQ